MNAQLAEQFDGRLRIGRTSFRLRNPDNAPPPWAVDAVTRAENRRHVFEGPDEAMGFLLPISAGGLCLTCHGKADTLDADLARAIEDSYPEDRATGFGVGDLRGYFWVESR